MLYIKCKCTSISGPIGTLWFYSPECDLHKLLAKADSATWEDIEAALKIVEQEKKKGGSN